MKEFLGDALINEGFGTIGFVFFIILVVVFALQKKLNGEFNSKKDLLPVLTVAVFWLAIYAFTILLIVNFTPTGLEDAKNIALVLALLISAHARKNQESQTSDSNDTQLGKNNKKTTFIFKKKWHLIQYLSTGAFAVLVAFSIVSGIDVLSKITTLLNDIWGIIATILLGYTSFVKKEKK